MKTEEEIREKIENCKTDIVNDVLSGIVTREILNDLRIYIDALEWVLEDTECQKQTKQKLKN